jgi:tetratricopeptide (TPR) repeat protein
MDGAGLVAPRWRRLRLLAAAMLLAAFVLSCGPKVKVAPVPPPSPEQQPTPFQSAERYYEAKQYGKAMALYRDFLRRQPTHPSADTAIIKLATILTAFGNNAEAADWYRRLLLTRPASPYAPQAAGELISILFIEERYAELIAVARKLGPNMLSGAIGARTLMLIGDAYRITGDTPAAAAAYIRGQQNSPSPDDPRWEEKIEGTIGSLSLADIDRLTADLQAREIRPRLLLLLARANGDREQWQAAVRGIGSVPGGLSRRPGPARGGATGQTILRPIPPQPSRHRLRPAADRQICALRNAPCGGSNWPLTTWARPRGPPKSAC